MPNKKVSIIVPVYNVENYLCITVDSILHQNYGNFELILVNDGSTDNSGTICDNYKETDDRVRVFHKENSGSSDARNMGLDNAKGEFILFVDADDYITSDMLTAMIDLMKSDTDVVVCDFAHVQDSDYEAYSLEPKEHEVRTLDATKALEDMMYQRFITNSPWAKLYKASLFNGVRFPSGKINQDLGTIYKALAKANKVSLINKKMYMYMFRPDSVINSKFSSKRMAGLQFAEEQYKFIINKFPEIQKAAINRLFMESVFILQKMGIRGVFNYKNEYLMCTKKIKDTRTQVLRDSESSSRYRFFAVLACINPLLVPFSGDAIRTILALRNRVSK